MGYTNLQVALTYAYRRWLGEKAALQKEIARIEQEVATLGEKRARVVQCDRLVASVDVIMSEVSDKWDPASIKPALRNISSLPFENGDLTRWTMDVLRRASGPARAIQIARQIVAEQGLDVEDKGLVRQINQAVDTALRSMKKRNHVGKTDDDPVRWHIVGRDYPT